jgi:hypothetical protein
VRALLVTNDGRVIFDTDGTFAAGAQMAETERAPLVQTHRAQLNTLIRGRFLDPGGQEWLYVGQPILRFRNMQPETPFILVAAPVPQPSVKVVINVFGEPFEAAAPGRIDRAADRRGLALLIRIPSRVPSTV